MFGAIICQLKNLIFLFIGLFGVGFLIGFHEFGHYLFARLFGVRAPSFSIGMGPKIFSKKIAGTEFRLSAIPLGGYVEIAGRAEVGQGDQKDAHARDEGSFQVKPYWQKFLIMSGGIIFNLFLTFLIFIGLFATGMPKSLLLAPEKTKPIIARIQEDSAADAMNIKVGDTIFAINNQPVTDILQVMQQLQKSKSNTVTLTILRNNKKVKMSGQLDETGRLGIDYKTDYLEPLSIIQSISASWETMTMITKKVIDSFANLFKKPSSLKGFSGPIHIISIAINQAKQGSSVFLFLMAYLSLYLAIFNLIPLPITDGGQIVFLTIEAIIGRQLPEKIHLIIHYISWGLILALAAYLMVKDSILLFWPTIKKFLIK